MVSGQQTVHYCCVSRGGRILYAYNGMGSEDGHEKDSLAALCIERAPQYHRWYFQTMGRRTYGFLMEDGCVYFAIAGHGLGSHGLLQFLERMRDDCKRVSSRRGLKGSLCSLNSFGFQEQLLPVVHQLISSLEHMSHQAGSDWSCTASSSSPSSPTPVESLEHWRSASLTKAPLLGKLGKHDRKAKEQVITVNDTAPFEEHRRSADTELRGDVSDPHNQGMAVASMSLQREMSGSMRRSVSVSIRRKWCRQVRIVVALDAAICFVLFIVWLVFCQGFKCLR